MDKFKKLPKVMQAGIVGMLIGATGAGILTWAFKIELGQILGILWFLTAMSLGYILIYKPFKKKEG